MRDRLQIRVQDGPLGVERLAVAVRGCEGIEALGELKLGARRDVALVLEDDNLVVEEGRADDVKVGVEEVTDLTGILPNVSQNHQSPLGNDGSSRLTCEVLNINARD